MITCVGLLISVATTRAELPPAAYAKYQADAPEALDLHVRAVNVIGSKPSTVTVDADVIGVTRSAAGLKIGDVIQIHYTSHVGEMIAGPSPMPILQMDDHCPAFLKKEGSTFVPAAGGRSFMIEDLRLYATEKLIVAIKSRDLAADTHPQRVTYLATVQAISQSLSGLHLGDVIQIDYELGTLAPTATLEPNHFYAAFLHRQQSGKRYYPAAGVQTFAPATRPTTTTAPAK